MDKRSSRIAVRVQQLREIFSKIGISDLPKDADSHKPYDFSNPDSPKYLCFETQLATSAADSLARIVNQRLAHEEIPATIRIDSFREAEYRHGRDVAMCTVEIVPSDNIQLPQSFNIPFTQDIEESQLLSRQIQMQYATDECLKRLPRLIRDLHMKRSLNSALYPQNQA